jgi:hypothetical protein
MADSFTALPRTFVVSFDSNDPDGRNMIPVMGWAKGLSGYDPITVVPEDGRMVFGKAICLMTDDDVVIVTDPISKKTFYDINDWLSYMKGAKPVAKPDVNTGVRRRVNLYIQFGDKTYVNKSFWHFKTPSDEFLFTLEGEQEAPDDARVQKINRDAFYNARKTLDVMPYDDLFNVTGQAQIGRAHV